ncbi:MAG: YdcH family protein, partial [Gammaproteobacteria bacterium]|nr:YdcH family protein [Gammaproteobacteria bacterium]
MSPTPLGQRVADQTIEDLKKQRLKLKDRLFARFFRG